MADIRVDTSTLLELGLLFDAVIEQVKLLDEQSEDSGLTHFTLAIEALAQRGYDEIERLTCRTQSGALVLKLHDQKPDGAP